MQTPSGKTSEFPDGKTISMLPSGKTDKFPDGKRILMLSSGETGDFPDENYDCDENRYIVTNDEKQQKDFSFF